MIKAPKVYLNDTGLLCHLLGLDARSLMLNESLAGHIFENFVCMELVKQMGWSKTSARLYHFRPHSGSEVDFVLEGPQGKIIGIEVKSKQMCAPPDARGLQDLKDASGDKFHRGVILYRGKKPVFLNKDIIAIPASALWNTPY